MTIDPRLNRIVAAQPCPLLFATISGAHLYGFPSPDSDFDLRGVHILPLPNVVGLEIRDETLQDERIIEGLEMDIVSHDVRKFFQLLLKKNGYVLEQLFSPLIVHTTPEHAELMAICNPRQSDGRTARQRPGVRQPSGAFAGEPDKSQANAGGLDALGKADSSVSGPLLEKAPEGWTHSGTLRAVGECVNNCASGVITKHHAHHYFGFAETQWKLFEKERPRRVKPLLYVYRVLLTGIHLMRTGLVEANLVTLNETFRLPFIPDLIARKLSGPEQSTLDDADIAFYEAEYQRLRGELQSAHDASLLPELPDDATRAALNALLVKLRLKPLGLRQEGG